MKIYIAGPYTNGDVAMNVRKAIETGNLVRELTGHTPFIPHLTHFWHLITPHEVEFWYEYDLEWLEKCDAILRLEGKSIGADREVERAVELGLDIYFNIWEIPVKV